MTAQRSSSPPDRLPEGFHYLPDAISHEEEQHLIDVVAAYPLAAVVMRGYTAKRRTAHYGASYEYDTRRAAAGPPIPSVLLSLRDAVAARLGLDAAPFTEALVTEYPPGAVIGWHRDAPAFGPAVIGVSLASECRMRFRRTHPDGAIERASIVLDRRSAYLLDGPARTEWQHSIPAAGALRYSITFRSLKRARL
jgi:alkylated DNA repair protein (DNA oxidative demethylase)